MRWAAHIVSMPDDDVTKQWNAPDAPMFWVGRPNTFILTPLTTADIFKSHLPDIPFTGPLLHFRAKHATNWHIPTEKEVMIVHMISWIEPFSKARHLAQLEHTTGVTCVWNRSAQSALSKEPNASMAWSLANLGMLSDKRSPFPDACRNGVNHSE